MRLSHGLSLSLSLSLSLAACAVESVEVDELATEESVEESTEESFRVVLEMCPDPAECETWEELEPLPIPTCEENCDWWYDACIEFYCHVIPDPLWCFYECEYMYYECLDAC